VPNVIIILIITFKKNFLATHTLSQKKVDYQIVAVTLSYL